MALIENDAHAAGVDTATGAPSATSTVPTSTHNHAVALDGGASGATSADVSVGSDTHNHAVALDGGTTADEAAHTHAVALDGGTTGAGAAHHHAFGPSAVTIPSLLVGVAFVAPAARAVAVHAQVLGGDANAFPGPFTNPAIPRAVQCTFGAAWDGGVVTVDGADETDAVIHVAIDPAGVLPGGGVVQGANVMKTVTGATKAALVPASVTTCDLQTGVALGLGAVPATGAYRQEVMDGTTLEAAVLFDGGKGITLGTPPNGVHDYFVQVNKASAAGNIAGDTADENVHAHGPGTLSDAASGTGSAHNHGPGTLADAASGTPSATTSVGAGAHTHGPGTLSDAATGAPSATTTVASPTHTHVETE